MGSGGKFAKVTLFVKPRFRIKMKFTETDNISLKGTHSFSEGDGH